MSFLFLLAPRRSFSDLIFLTCGCDHMSRRGTAVLLQLTGYHGELLFPMRHLSVYSKMLNAPKNMEDLSSTDDQRQTFGTSALRDLSTWLRPLLSEQVYPTPPAASSKTLLGNSVGVVAHATFRVQAAGLVLCVLHGQQ